MERLSTDRAPFNNPREVKEKIQWAKPKLLLQEFNSSHSMP
jgi:hypothetical protein